MDHGSTDGKGESRKGGCPTTCRYSSSIQRLKKREKKQIDKNRKKDAWVEGRRWREARATRSKIGVPEDVKRMLIWFAGCKAPYIAMMDIGKVKVLKEGRRFIVVFVDALKPS